MNIFVFQYYGTMLAVATIISIVISFIISKEKFFAIVSFYSLAIPLGIVCSRLLFFIANFSYYVFETNNPLAILYIWDGGLSMVGLLFSVFISFIILSKFSLFNNIVRLKNSVFLSICAFIAIERIAELATNVGIGKYINTSSKSFFIVYDDLDFASLAVHKMEAVFAMFMLIALTLTFNYLYKHNKVKYPIIEWLFLLLFSSSQVLFESMRNDGHMIFGFIHVQQLIYAFIPLLLIIYLNYLLKKENIKQSIYSIITVAFLLLVYIALEFSLDGRLYINFKLFNFSEMLRDYIIMSLVSIITISLTLKPICKIAK